MTSSRSLRRHIIEGRCSRLRGAGLLLALAAAPVLGCSEPSTENVTALRVAAAWSGMQVDQLEYAIMTTRGALHEPQRLPAVAGAALASGVDVVIYLPDQLAGQSVDCRVIGYLHGLPQGQGQARAEVVAGTVVDLKVTLPGASPPDGGPGSDAGSDGKGPRGKANGQSCGSGDDCTSGQCADGVCCQSECAGVCQACNLPGRAGSCVALAAGTPDALCPTEALASCGLDGTCDGSGSCRRHPAGTRCQPGTCSGNMVMGSGACDGAGSCLVTAARSCGAYLCDPATTSCRSSCSSVKECSSPNVCSSAGRCGDFKPLGAACATGPECGSGNCVDGACCSSASCDFCFTCNLAGSAGSCHPVPDGAPEPQGLCPSQPVSTCGLDGACNGQGGCRSYPNGTICRVGKICFNGVCR